MSSSGIGRDVHSLMFPIQLFLCRSQRRPPSKVPLGMVLERLSWRETCPNHASFRLLAVSRRGSCGPTRKPIRTQSRGWYVLTTSSRRLGEEVRAAKLSLSPLKGHGVSQCAFLQSEKDVGGLLDPLCAILVGATWVRVMEVHTHSSYQCTNEATCGERTELCLNPGFETE